MLVENFKVDSPDVEYTEDYINSTYRYVEIRCVTVYYPIKFLVYSS